MTFGVEGPAAAALESKLKGTARASVSSGPAVSQAIVLAALGDQNLAEEQAVLMEECTQRYQTLKKCHRQGSHEPFNSGFRSDSRVR